MASSFKAALRARERRARMNEPTEATLIRERERYLYGQALRQRRLERERQRVREQPDTPALSAYFRSTT